MKRLLQSNVVQKIIVFAFLIFYTILYFTWRKKVIYHPETQDLVNQNKPFAVAMWHQNNFTNIWLVKVVNALVLASPSFEGKMIGLVMEKMGGTVAWGSSRKQPISALKSLVRMTRETQKNPVITVDGPIGPRHIPKAGIIEVAKLSRLPIVPLGTKGKNSWTLKKTWDLTEIPKPFSKVVYYFGKPLDYKSLDSKSESSIVILRDGINSAQQKTFDFV